MRMFQIEWNTTWKSRY